MSTPVSPTLYFDPEAYSTAGPKLMGRHAAGEQFLRALLQHARAPSLHAWMPAGVTAQAVQQAVAAAGGGRQVDCFDASQLQRMRSAGLLYVPAPDVGRQAWMRSVSGHAAWSLCGVTHTTASAQVMQGLADLVTAPVQPWDAVICTSPAVRATVDLVLQAQVDHLKDRLGITRVVLPERPVIPLGVHCSDFDFTTGQRANARRLLGLDADTVVVLFLGRLSPYAKANPLAMYQALQLAATRSGKPWALLECGWSDDARVDEAYLAAQALACPDVRVHTLEGRDRVQRDRAWAAADVFCSLSDNVQETFGLTPLEAMAAGLPVVVSDWDGYRSTVRDGVDGFRIRTVMPPAGVGLDLAQRHGLGLDPYGLYCGESSMLIAVDVEQAAAALLALGQDPLLRARMGAAGRQQARDAFDWRHVIARYEALWSHLAEVRTRSAAAGHRPAGTWPAHLSPFDAFAHYPSLHLGPETVLACVDADLAASRERVARLMHLAVVAYARTVTPRPSLVDALLGRLAAGPATADTLLRALQPEAPGLVMRALAWLLKLGVIRVS